MKKRMSSVMRELGAPLAPSLARGCMGVGPGRQWHETAEQCSSRWHCSRCSMLSFILS